MSTQAHDLNKKLLDKRNGIKIPEPMMSDIPLELELADEAATDITPTVIEPVKPNGHQKVTVTRGDKLVDLQRLGKMLAASGYFQDVKDLAQACVKIMAGEELGFGPIASMTGIFIIKGKVSLSANLMAAAVRRAGYDFRITEFDEKHCVVEFFDKRGKSLGASPFSMDDAKKAQLASSDNWTKYPRNMLFARAMSNGCKWFTPDAFGGSPPYTPDELGAQINGETGEIA